MTMMEMSDGAGWWMLWGVLMMLLFWGGLAALVIWVVQLLSRGSRSNSRSSDSNGSSTRLDIAKQRYARGEIDREEFEQLRRDLA